MQQKRVLILGGGFGGIYTALRLGNVICPADELEVDIINRENYMVFQPMLPEVVSGGIDLLHCISPIKRLCPKATLYTREIENIDLQKRIVTTSPGFGRHPLTISYDYLVMALGTVNDFSSMPGLTEHALPFKNLADAIVLRNRIIQVLGEASVEKDPVLRQSLMTFVIAGGGFSGVEVAAEINDFIHYAVGSFRELRREEFRVILVHSGQQILPELTERLGGYARRLLEKRGVEFRLKDRVREATADAVIFKSGEKIQARTLVSTVPSAPNPHIAALDCEKVSGRIATDGSLRAKGLENVWAVGDCAHILKKDGDPSPPTAQFAVRQAVVVADNIIATHRGSTKRSSFNFSGLGKAGALGRRSAVADVMGLPISGLAAWFFWRTLYWFKMPGLDRKIRVGVDWLLDLVLPRDLVQLKIDPSKSFSMQHFEPGDFIFKQGEPGDKMYVLVRGEAEVVMDPGLPSERAVAKLGPNQYFGEMALFTGSARSASVRTLTTVDAMTISREEFNLLIANVPAVKEVFEKEIKRRCEENLRKTDQ